MPQLQFTVTDPFPDVPGSISSSAALCIYCNACLVMLSSVCDQAGFIFLFLAAAALALPSFSSTALQLM